MNKWKFDPTEDSAITEVETGEVIVYVDTIHPEVILKLVELHNEEYSLKKIKDYLESDERVTPEEVEFLMEELEKCEEMEKKIEKTKEQTAPMKEAPFPLNLEEQKDPVPTKEDLIEKATKQEKMAIYADEKHTNDESVATVTTIGRKGKRNTATTTGKKKLSLEDMIQEMESKIELAKVFQNIPEIPFPENMGKSARDLMIRFQKEYKELVEKYIGEIQEL